MLSSEQVRERKLNMFCGKYLMLWKNLKEGILIIPSLSRALFRRLHFNFG